MQFKAKVQYQKKDEETSKTKTITEAYLVQGATFTDVEARLYQEYGSLREFSVTRIDPIRFADVFQVAESGQEWYKCKTVFMTQTKKGKEKPVVNLMLVNAENPTQAIARIYDQVGKSMISYEVKEAAKTDILDVIGFAD